jgi:hypothetical protein
MLLTTLLKKLHRFRPCGPAVEFIKNHPDLTVEDVGCLLYATYGDYSLSLYDEHEWPKLGNLHSWLMWAALRLGSCGWGSYPGDIIRAVEEITKS